MPTNLEGRTVRLETLVQWVQIRVRAAFDRLDALDNQARQASGIQYGWNDSGGSSGGVCFCVTPSTGSWAGGAPPGGTPGSFTADVYKIDGASYAPVASGADVYNGYPSSPGTSKVVAVSPNGDGTYSVVGESCA